MSMKNLFEAASSKFELDSTFEEFESKMAIPQKRRVVYDALQEHYQLPPFEEFDVKVQSYIPKPEKEFFGKGGPIQQFPRKILAGAMETGRGITDLAQRLYEVATPEEIREPFVMSEEDRALVKAEEEAFIKSVSAKPVGVAGYIGAVAGSLAEFVAEMWVGGAVLGQVTKAKALWMASKVPRASKYGQISRYMVNKVATDAPVFTAVQALRTEGGIEERVEAGMQGLKMSLVFGLIGAIPGRTLSVGTLARVPLGNFLLGTNPFETASILKDKTISQEDKLTRLVDTAINSWFSRKGATKESLQSLHKNIEASYRSQGKRVPDYISKSIDATDYSGQIMTKVAETPAVEPAKKVATKPSPSKRLAEDVDAVKFIEAKVQELGSVDAVKSHYKGVTGVTRYARKYADYMFGEEVVAKGPVVKDKNYSPSEIKPAPYNPVDKIIEVIHLAKPARTRTRVLQHEELQRRAKRLHKVYAEAGGTETSKAAMRVLKGKLPKAAFDAPKDKITAADFDALNKAINTTGRITLPFDRVHASVALYKTWLGEVPTASEIRILGKVFGPAFSRVLYDKRTQGQKAWQNALDYANVPRTVLTMWDMSAAGRQGLILGVRHPSIWGSAVKTGFKAIRKESVAVAVEESIRSNIYYELSQTGKNRLYIAERGVTGAISAAEESFMSRTALRIPGAKWSERAYVTTLNKLRMDYFASVAKKWEGTNKTAQDYSDLAKYINEATGRGTFNMQGDGGAILNAMFFSPRFVASRIQLPLRMFTSTPTVRKIVAGDLVAFVGANITMLALASQIPGVDVEIDPRSSDFGKVRIGDTRIDTWAGYAPIARFVTQFATGKRKSVGTGEIMEIERYGVVERFIQSKLSPMAGLGVDIVRGRTFTGEDVTPRLPSVLEKGLKSVIEEPNVLKQIWARLVPMFVQDVAEAIRYQGLAGGFVAIPAFLGLGVQTYPETNWTKTRQYKEMLSQDNFGIDWDELDANSQTVLRQQHPEIEEMERAAKMDSDAVFSTKYSIKEQQEAAKDIRESLPKDIQNKLDELLIKPTGISRRIYRDWDLNDKRFELYKSTTISILNIILPSLMNSPQWQSATVAEQRWAVEESFTRAKKEARMSVLQNANRFMFRQRDPSPSAGLR